MRHYVYLVAALALLAGIPHKAEAATAYTTGHLGLRAGPSMDYPVFTRLDPHSSVSVIGCVRGMAWCDVSVDGMRGWVGGRNLITPYRHRNSTILDIGAALGLPIVSFNERDYWGHYYYDRDFYRVRYGYHHDADRWGWEHVNGHWQHSNKWRDTDHDGIPNRHDHDDDNDGVSDRHDRDNDNDGRNDRWDHNDNDRHYHHHDYNN